jgi:hypothetical protein
MQNIEKRKIDARFIALAASLVALTAVFGLIPFVFLVPLLLTATFGRLRLTLTIACAFGLVSYLYSFMGNTVVSLWFVANPAVPIVPRILVGIMIHFVYVGLLKLLNKSSDTKKSNDAVESQDDAKKSYHTVELHDVKNSYDIKKSIDTKKQFVVSLVTAITGSLLNTVFVVAFLLILPMPPSLDGVTVWGYVPVMLIFGAIEIAATGIIIPALRFTLHRGKVLRPFFPELYLRGNDITVVANDK